MRNAIPAEPERDTEINLTPMLDVVFIMLIFFIVTASFIKDFGLDITLPSVIDDGREAEAIVVTIEADDSLHLNGRVLAPGSLAPMVRRLAGENPDAPFSVRMAPGSHVDAMAIAVDAGRQAGFGVIPVQSQ